MNEQKKNSRKNELSSIIISVIFYTKNHFDIIFPLATLKESLQNYKITKLTERTLITNNKGFYGEFDDHGGVVLTRCDFCPVI